MFQYKFISSVFVSLVLVSCGTSETKTKTDSASTSTDSSSSTATNTSTSTSTASSTSTSTTPTSTSSCAFDAKANGVWKIGSDYYSIGYVESKTKNSFRPGDFYMSQCFEAGSTGVNSAYACFAAGKLSYTGSTVSNTYTFSDANTLVIGAGTDAFSNAIKGTYTKTTLPSTYTCPSGSF